MKKYSVFVGGVEVNDTYLTKKEAIKIRYNYIMMEYDDVKIVIINK